MKSPCVYILANKKYGTLYVGVGFTHRYKIDLLIYFEQHQTMEAAIFREKQIKHWNRQWKINLIETVNPIWSDLYKTII